MEYRMGFLSSLSENIDYKIEDAIGAKRKKKLIVQSTDLPAYRFVDLYNAVTATLEPRRNIVKIETQQQETLNQLIHDRATRYVDRSLRRSPRVAWQTALDEEAYLPVDCFWLCPSTSLPDNLVVRVLFEEFSQKARIEVACADSDAGKALLKTIVDHSVAQSIYRNHVLMLSYEAGKTDAYGDIEKPERFQVMFSAAEPVTDKDIVLNDEQLKVLKRNVIDLHERREILASNGVAARRGVLLHGPPGTGKTFACRYLCHELDGVTRIFVTGSSLTNISSIFSFARLMQPSVLFLEDVDLVFAAREINLYSSALGDLLDQLDGLRSHENIGVVLTTNAIDRLEAAIKDRPGRISQCIYMGAPAPDQRRVFLRHQLADHNADAVDLDQLVKDTEDATQAFMKEWVVRAVQIACERFNTPGKKAVLQNADFKEAMDEMRRFLDGSEGRIIGFLEKK